MPRNYYALCHLKEEFSVHRIPLHPKIQRHMDTLFDIQEEVFLHGRHEEVEFTGDWNPDPDQLLVINDPKMAGTFNRIVEDSPIAFPILDVARRVGAGVKAVFTTSEAADGRLLIQPFRSSQYLQRRKFTIVRKRNQFERLSEEGFSLASSLAAILEGSEFKFLSFHTMRAMIPLQHHFTEATHQEVAEFADHELFLVEDRDLFMQLMDQGTRKLIHGIGKSEVLGDFDAADISNRAKKIGLQLEERDEKLVLPTTKRELKTALRFLEESVYKGSFSDKLYETNSKRAL